MPTVGSGLAEGLGFAQKRNTASPEPGVTFLCGVCVWGGGVGGGGHLVSIISKMSLKS